MIYTANTVDLTIFAAADYPGDYVDPIQLREQGQMAAGNGLIAIPARLA